MSDFRRAIPDIRNTSIGIAISDADGKIAVAVIGLAHAPGLKVVAEGVETEKQRAFLLDHDCDIFQGYLFSRPLSVADFGKKFAELKQVAQ